MWRPCCLLVGKGMHFMGWTRDQAMGFLASDAPLSLHEVRMETDGTFPGRAECWRTIWAKLKIRDLPARVEQRSGERFELRAFHDELLRHGPVPLDVRESQIDARIGTRASRP